MGKKKQKSKKELDELFEDVEDPLAAGTPSATSKDGNKKSGKGEPVVDVPDVSDDLAAGGLEGKKKKKKGKKSKKQENLFQDSDNEHETMDSKQVDLTRPKKSKAKAGFGALAGSNDEGSNSSGLDNEEEHGMVPAAQGVGETSDGSVSAEADVMIANGKAKSGKELSFAALGAADKSEDEDEQEDVQAAKPKAKKKKKKSRDIESALAALEIEEENADEQEGTDTIVAKPSGSTSGPQAVDHGSQAATEPPPDNSSSLKGKSKASKKKSKLLDLEDAFTSLESGTVNESVGDENAPQVRTKKKKKSKPVGIDFDALMDELDEPDVNAEESISEKNKQAGETLQDTLQPVPNTDSINASAKGEPAESLELPSRDISESKAGKKKKKKGKTSTPQTEENIDAILAEIEGLTTAPDSVEPVPQTSESTLPIAETTLTEEVEVVTAMEEAKSADVKTEADPAEHEEDGQEESKTLTAAQKKKLRKKAKKAKESAVEEEAPKATKEKKVPAHIRKIQEAQEKRRLEEERLRQLEEERLRQEEEEKQREEELQRQKEEEKERKRLEKERLRKSGAPLTKKAQEEARRRELMREKLLEQAAAKGITLPGASEAAEASSGKVDDLRTRTSLRRQQKQREQQRIAEEKEKAEQDRLRKQAEEAEARREALRLEEEKKKAEAEQCSEDDAPDDWDVDSNEKEDDEPPEVEEEAMEKKDSEEAKSESESESETESETESEEESSDYTADSEEEREKRLEATKQRMENKIQEAKATANADNLRSPICCILGHVDTGKTKILDNIRRTNVQDNEAGGITQQIGATYIPKEAILARTETLRQGRDYNLKVPGMLVIDTPGHESFTNLRSRGSSLCDIAILVVDLMHGLEPQTIESINLLKQRKTPFVVALNKVDRLLDWKTIENNPIRASLQQQKKHSKVEFEDRMKMCTTQLMEQGMNVSLYWKNNDPRKVVNMIPTSAITGEGIPDLLQLVVKLTTSLMSERLMFLGDVLQCTVLEVKAIEGLGTTIDVVLVNGELHEGDKIVVCGMAGPIITNVRSLLTPHPLKELRVKGSYLHHKTIQAAQGVKLCAQGLEQAVAGTAMYVARDESEVQDLCLVAKEEMESVMSRIDRSGEGVCVQASTLGSLEALLDFLKTPEVNIPVSAINIGPVHKRDIMRANVMIEKKMRKYGVILAFDVPVTKEARDMAEDMGVKVFTADIIYHLFDQFKNYMEEVRRAEKTAARDEAVFPCILKIIPTCIFNAKDPIVLGVEVLEGQLRIGTPLCVPSKAGRGEVSLGRIDSLELNHKAVEEAHRGDSVAVKIRATSAEEAARLYGRHFDHTDELVSRITRESIDALKAFFKDEMSKDDWKVVIRLKQVFQVQ